MSCRVTSSGQRACAGGTISRISAPAAVYGPRRRRCASTEASSGGNSSPSSVRRRTALVAPVIQRW
jgi:hypothetical protein